MMQYVRHLDKQPFIPIQVPTNAQMHIIIMINIDSIIATFWYAAAQV